MVEFIKKGTKKLALVIQKYLTLQQLNECLDFLEHSKHICSLETLQLESHSNLCTESHNKTHLA